MKLVWFMLSVLIAFAAADDESSKFIVGGRDAHIEDYPHMAGIMNFGVALCGGAIVNERSVLTVNSIHLLRNNAFQLKSLSRQLTVL